MSGSSSPAKSGNHGFLVGRHGDDHLRRLEAPLARLGDEDAIPLGKAVNAHPGPYRKREAGRIRFEVVGHLVLGRERFGRRREGHAVEGIVLSRREETERVPAATPHIADPRVGVEDDEGQPLPLQMIAGGQARVAGSDDDDVEAFGRRGHCRDINTGLPGGAPARDCAGNGGPLLEILAGPAGVGAGSVVAERAGRVSMRDGVHDVLPRWAKRRFVEGR